MLKIWDTNTRWWLADSSNISTTLRTINAQELHSLFTIYHLGSKELVLNSPVLSSQHTCGCSGLICCNFYSNILILIVLEMYNNVHHLHYDLIDRIQLYFCRIKFQILNAKKGDWFFRTLYYCMLYSFVRA